LVEIKGQSDRGTKAQSVFNQLSFFLFLSFYFPLLFSLFLPLSLCHFVPLSLSLRYKILRY
jgi:hypothetical protein